MRKRCDLATQKTILTEAGAARSTAIPVWQHFHPEALLSQGCTRLNLQVTSCWHYWLLSRFELRLNMHCWCVSFIKTETDLDQHGKYQASQASASLCYIRCSFVCFSERLRKYMKKIWPMSMPSAIKCFSKNLLLHKAKDLSCQMLFNNHWPSSHLWAGQGVSLAPRRFLLSCRCCPLLSWQSPLPPGARPNHDPGWPDLIGWENLCHPPGMIFFTDCHLIKCHALMLACGLHKVCDQVWTGVAMAWIPVHERQMLKTNGQVSWSDRNCNST